MSTKPLNDAPPLLDQLRAWRRYLHERPELSGEEQHTADFLSAELAKIGLQPAERVAETFGVTAEFGPADRPVVALRADMDALPVQEEADVPFRSQNPGVMHACGHDAHMAMLLGAATLLKRNEASLPRRVRLIFQPQEERPPGGAKPMIEAGVLDDVQSIFGLHIWSQLPAGVLGVRTGPFMASVNNFQITIRGRGGHAAMPHECVDPIVVAATVVQALQTISSRSLSMTDSAVLSVTRIDAGRADNIIPPAASLRGTIRTLDDAVRGRVLQRLRALAEHTCRGFDAEADIEVFDGYPTLVNDDAAVARALRAARALDWDEDQITTLDPQGGGEDFAWYGRYVPAAFVFLGGGPSDPRDRYPHHHPRFTISEDALPLGTALLTQYVLEHANEAET